MFTRTQIAEARKIAKNYGVNALLTSPSANPKTDKNSKRQGILTAPLHFSPHTLSGFNVCPMASDGCIAACLHTAGNPAYRKNKYAARLNRTRFWFKDRDAFMIMLYAEIAKHEKAAAKRGMFAGVRLNATSDISWEIYRLPNGQNIMEAFPDVTFYDYTAIVKRAKKFANGEMPANYFLTFSAKENNEAACIEVLNAGGNVAMVFSTSKYQTLPEFYKGFPVIDGDVHDYRPADPKGSIAGLRAKGDARHDTSGFVRQV